MSDQISRIKISDIDRADLRYQISSQIQNTGGLAASIKKTGLIYPVWLKPVSGRFIIISGFNRIEAAIQNRHTHIPAFLCPEDLTEPDCCIKAIAAVAFNRPLSAGELVKGILNLSPHLTAEQISDLGEAVFNRKLNPAYIKNIFALKKLPSKAIELMDSGRLTLKALQKINTLDNDFVHTFLTLFHKIKASSNIQIELIRHIFEICRRDNVPVNIFAKEHIDPILNDTQTDSVSKTRKIRQTLYQIRFPAVYENRCRLENRIKSLKLDQAVKFIPAENFEDNRFLVSFDAKNVSEYLSCVKHLENASQKDEFNSIFQR